MTLSSTNSALEIMNLLTLSIYSKTHFSTALKGLGYQVIEDAIELHCK